jgi:hypothetical protein
MALSYPFAALGLSLSASPQAWHWLDESSRVAEAFRVLRPGGRWAGWWSHARADAQRWFDRYWTAIECSCPGTHRDQRDIDWGATVAVPGVFEVDERITIPWVRHISVEDWMTDQASHSYVAALPPQPRTDLLSELRTILDEQFPDGAIRVQYETWLWIATRTREGQRPIPCAHLSVMSLGDGVGGNSAAGHRQRPHPTPARDSRAARVVPQRSASSVLGRTLPAGKLTAGSIDVVGWTSRLRLPVPCCCCRRLVAMLI